MGTAPTPPPAAGTRRVTAPAEFVRALALLLLHPRASRRITRTHRPPGTARTGGPPPGWPTPDGPPRHWLDHVERHDPEWLDSREPDVLQRARAARPARAPAPASTGTVPSAGRMRTAPDVPTPAADRVPAGERAGHNEPPAHRERSRLWPSVPPPPRGVGAAPSAERPSDGSPARVGPERRLADRPEPTVPGFESDQPAARVPQDRVGPTDAPDARPEPPPQPRSAGVSGRARRGDVRSGHPHDARPRVSEDPPAPDRAPVSPGPVLGRPDPWPTLPARPPEPEPVSPALVRRLWAQEADAVVAEQRRR